MDIKILIAFLPVVFMLHDFEEIIMFRPWLEKNRDEIKHRFPRVDRLLVRSHDHLSTSAFAIAVLHEFILIAIVIFLSLYFNAYQWWFAAFTAFSLHLIVHILQWIAFGKYVPVVITSFLALSYCIYTTFEFLKVTDMTNAQLMIWIMIGLIVTVASFFPAFFLASKFERWKNQNYLSKTLQR